MRDDDSTIPQDGQQGEGAAPPSPAPAAATTEGTRTFDVFLSYNSADRAQVEAVGTRLRELGLTVWLDRWELVEGGQWQDELASGLRRSKSCAVFIGPNGVGDWSRMELMHALDLAAKGELLRVFPVLLPGVPEPFDSAALPPFLSSRSWVDLRGGWAKAAEVQPLVNAIHGVAAGAAPDVVVDDAVCPYVGLRPFEAEDALWYVGREGDVQRLVEHLRHHSFVAVLGPSGSGKSSLVRAGLLPALSAGELPGSAHWRLVTVKPGARPIEALAAAVAHQFPAQQPTVLADGLRADPRTLDLAVETGLQAAPFDERIVWVVDQFEELFTLCTDDHDRRRFVENLLHATAPGTSRNVVVMTMRSDFYGACATLPELARAVEARQFLVSDLQPDDLRRIVEVPAQLADLELEAGLSQTILRDVADEPGGLPLLQHALLELWERRRGRMLTLEAYREAGGVDGALAHRAEDTWRQLGEPQQAAGRRLFLRLTQPGEGTGDTRRRVPWIEVEGDADTDATTAVIDRFVQARLLTSGIDDEGERTVDVAHEALIRSWPRLRAWLDEDRAGLRLHRRITEAAAAWESGGRDESLLWRGSQLVQAEDLLGTPRGHDLDARERGFVEAGIAHREELLERSRRRTKVLLAIAAIVVVVVGALAVVAFLQRQEAQDQAALAQAKEAEALANAEQATRNETVARASALAGEARDLIDFDPQLAVRLAIEAVELNRSVGSTEALTTTVLMEALLGDRMVSDVREGGGFDVQFVHDGSILTAGPKGLPVPDAGFVMPSLVDPVTGEVLREYELPYEPQHLAPVPNVSRDGRLATMGVRNGAAPLVWDVDTGEVVAELGGIGDEYAVPRLSPSGAWVVAIDHPVDENGERIEPPSPDHAHAVKVWEVGTGRPPVTLPIDSLVADVTDGGLVAVARDGMVQAELYDGRTGRLLGVVGEEVEGPVSTVVWLDERHLAIGRWTPGEVVVWDVETGEALDRLVVTEHLGDVCVSDEGTVAVGGLTKIHVWRPLSAVLPWSLPFPEFADGAEPTGLHCSPAGDRVVLGTTTGGRKVLDISGTGSRIGVAHRLEARPYRLQHTHDGERLVVVSHDRSIRVVDAGTGEQLSVAERALQPELPWFFVVSPDDALVAVEYEDETGVGVKVLGLPDLEEVSRHPMDSPLSAPMAFVGPDRLVVGDTGTLKVVDLPTGEVRVLEVPDRPSIDPFAAWVGGPHVARVTYEGQLQVIDTDTMEVVVDRDLSDNLGGNPRVFATEDGTRLVATDQRDVRYYVFDTAALLADPQVAPLQVVEGGSWEVISPSGRYLAMAEFSARGAVYDLVEDRVLFEMDQDGIGYGATFPPDESHIAVPISPNRGGLFAVRYLPTHLDDLLAHARQRVSAPMTPAQCERYLWQERCEELGLVAQEATGLAAPSEDEPADGPPPPVAGAAELVGFPAWLAADGRFSQLVRLLQETDTTFDPDGDGDPYSWWEIWQLDPEGADDKTFFAPTDDAFDRVLGEGGVDRLLALENDLRYAVLSRHMVGRPMPSGDFTTRDVQAWNGAVALDAEARTWGGHAIVEVDEVVADFTVHVIDGIVIPDFVLEALGAEA